MAGNDKLAVVVVGGSGDLARKKIFPALFALFCQNRLPADFCLIGFARSSLSDEAFRAKVAEYLTCRYTPDSSVCSTRMASFLDRCHYQRGEYGDADAYLDLFERLRATGDFHAANQIYYLAIPPSAFLDTAQAMGRAGLVPCGDRPHWVRVVVEKPFGRDRASSDELAANLALVFSERQTYRIDHYLGKEVIQNLLVLRFANTIFEPLWNCHYIDGVEIVWKENIGTKGRGGYFDQFGIIRDVIQNHLLQILAMVAMERPAAMTGKAIRDSKVAVLQAIPAASLADVRLGQYVAGRRADGKVEPGYREDETVPSASTTATFASVRLGIHNPRWAGVPFRITAGKGADERKTEVRIRFKPLKDSIFCNEGSCPPANELVIRIQPREGMHFTVVTKALGDKLALHAKELDLSYSRAFNDQEIPDAYESLLLDVVNGDKGLFIRDDELAAAWDIFTPLLHEIEGRQIVPRPYPFGDAAIFSEG